MVCDTNLRIVAYAGPICWDIDVPMALQPRAAPDGIVREAANIGEGHHSGHE